MHDDDRGSCSRCKRYRWLNRGRLCGDCARATYAEELAELDDKAFASCEVCSEPCGAPGVLRCDRCDGEPVSNAADIAIGFGLLLACVVGLVLGARLYDLIFG